MDQFIFVFYILFFVTYVVATTSLLIYASVLRDRLIKVEAEAKEHRNQLRSHAHGNESTHKSDPLTPLLGVVTPRDQ